MRALITGASSGIGYEMAKILDAKGIDVVITGRRRERLEALAKELNNHTEIITADISDREECIRIFREAGDVDIVINNAGVGVHGAFHETTLEDELTVLDTNITALHILTKLAYMHFRKKGSGYLMNVASSASFCPGPYFSSYYASKAYVLRLTQALWKEAREEDMGIHISVFCPGPVNTAFNDRAGVKAPLTGISAVRAADCAVKGMFQGKRIVTSGIGTAICCGISKRLPDRLALSIVAKIQQAKRSI